MVVDLAVLAAPSCDPFGNMTGTQGPSACGSLGFAMADAFHAEHVIAVTDHLAPFPCVPFQIPGNVVDQVVQVDRIGDPSQILSGTTVVTRSPDRLLIAELAAAFVEAAGIMREGFSFQAGAGGTSLAFTSFLRDRMRRRGVRAGYIRGGSTRVIVEMLESGETGAILDGQTFDADAVRSMRDNPTHIPTSPQISYNYHGKGNVASMLDCVVLGATEVDLQFNANVVTHSDGLLLHGLGGWSDALFSRCTILAIPTFRNRVPVIKDRVTTLCGPGDLIDVIVTEQGIAINPRRTDLIDAVSSSNLPLRSLEDLKADAESICGIPSLPSLGDRVIGIVEWVDGTVIDSIYEVL
jgi:citrate lyase subunit alpha/citrate CoA-transferase